MAISVTVNGAKRTLDADPDKPMLWVLREDLNLVGTKFGCGAGLCGACTVLLDGQAVRSCQTPLSEAAGHAITTIEHVGTTAVGRKLQAAWVEHDVPQCGYCQAGQIMSAASLLMQTPRPATAEIEGAMSGNICRCACYLRIRAAIHTAAGTPVGLAGAAAA